MVKSRATRQKELMDTQISSFKTFFSAEELFEKVSQQDAKIGIATVYRYLKSLREDNEIYSYTCRGKTIYSNSDKSHCHFICEETGKMIHFEIDNIDFLKDKVPGDISSFQLEVRGFCKDCK